MMRHFGRKGRYGTTKKASKRKAPKYAPYKSSLEKKVAQLLHKDYRYEPKGTHIEYLVPHKYNPDFVHSNAPFVLLEVKGYFRLSSEAAKYVHAKRANPDVEIIFLFSNPFKKAHPNCRPRRDGSVLTLHEWAIKEGFLYYHVDKLPEEIVMGTMTEEWIKLERERFGYAD
jgi:hypothetical protein